MFQQLVSSAHFGKRWAARCQLICEAAERPNVDLFGVLDALRDLWADPVGRASLRLAVLFLLGEEDGEAEVGNLDAAVHAGEHVVALDIAVQHIPIMHLLNALRSLIESVFAELLAVFPVLVSDDPRQGPVVHILQENPSRIVVLVQFDTLNDLIAIQIRNQTCLINQHLSLVLGDRFDIFQSKQLFIGESLYLVHSSDCPFADLSNNFVDGRGVFLLHLDGHAHIPLEFLVRSETLRLLPLLRQHHVQADERILLLRLIIKVLLDVHICTTRQAIKFDTFSIFIDFDVDCNVFLSVLLVFDQVLRVTYLLDFIEVHVVD